MNFSNLNNKETLDKECEIDIDIDNEWVESYKKQEEKYNDYYNEKVTSVKLCFLYINKDKEIVKKSNDKLILPFKSVLDRDQLIQIIKDKKLDNGKKYKLFSLLKYNIDLLPEEIDDFIHEQENNNYSSRFLIQEQHINDIYFTATISVFHSINTLYFLFKEENIERNQKNKYSQTRKKHKHFIQKSNKYTRHKKYKI